MALPTFHVDVPSSTGSTAYSSGEGAAAASANMWERLSQQFASWGQQVAANEGEKAGRVAGLDPQYRPDALALGVRGMAFERAATSTYLDQLQTKTRASLNDAYQAWEGLPVDQRTPAALRGQMEKLQKDTEKSDVFPDIAGRFRSHFSGLSQTYLNAAQRDYEGRQQDAAKAAAMVDTASMTDTGHRLASLAGPEADGELTKLTSDHAAKIEALVQDGTYTAVQGQKLKDGFRQSVLQTRLGSQFAATPDAQKPAFLDNFKKAYGAGVGKGAINIVYNGALDRADPGKPSPVALFSFLQAQGASRNEALMLTGAAASESGLNPNVPHDGGIGLGLFGHNGDRLQAMRAMAGSDRPDWRQQASFALKELRSRPEAALVAAAKTPEELAAAQMHFEQPQGYTKAAPQAGHNYTGRLNTLRRFSALGGGQEIPQAANPTLGLDPETYDASVKYMERGLRVATSQAEAVQRAALSDIEDKRKQIVDGVDVSAQDWAQLNAKYGVSTDPAIRDAFAQTGAQRAMLAGFRGRPPQEIEAQIAGMNAELSKGGDPARIQMRDVAQKYLDAYASERARDPIGRAAREGFVAQVPALDASTPDALAKSLAMRAPIAEQAAKGLGLKDATYLRPEERAAFKTLAAKGGPDMVQAAGAVARTLGPRLDGFLREVDGEAPKFAFAARLSAMGGDEGFLADFAERQRLANDPTTSRDLELPAQGAADKIANDVYGDALSAVPQFAAGARWGARSTFETRMKREGHDKTLSSSPARLAYERTLQEAIGAHFKGETQYGGVTAVKTGWFSSQRVLVPLGMRADRVGDALKSLTDADLKALPTPPVYGDGATAVPAEAIRSGNFVSIAPGVYRVALGDPKSSDPKWVATSGGKPFVLSLNALKDRLKQRLPDAYE